MKKTARNKGGRVGAWPPKLEANKATFALFHIRYFSNSEDDFVRNVSLQDLAGKRIYKT